MQVPLQVVFRNMAPSPAIEARIRERAEGLERYYDRIVSCRVAVELHHRHHHQGNLFHVRVDLKVPEGEIVASRAPAERHAHEDVYVAIRDAFDATRRRLEDYARRRRGVVKEHAVSPRRRIAELLPDSGRSEAPDGRRAGAHTNGVADTGFDRLHVGAGVRYAGKMGGPGPQASTVHPVGEPRRIVRRGNTPASRPTRKQEQSVMAKTLSNDSKPAAAGLVVSPEERQRMIAEAAYFRALQRGFSGGDPVEDWLAAEREIDARLLRSSRRMQPPAAALPARPPVAGAAARPAMPSR